MVANLEPLIMLRFQRMIEISVFFSVEIRSCVTSCRKLKIQSLFGVSPCRRGGFNKLAIGGRLLHMYNS